jgi:uncharacterized ferritin-like protein (DUF455 family)
MAMSRQPSLSKDNIRLLAYQALIEIDPLTKKAQVDHIVACIVHEDFSIQDLPISVIEESLIPGRPQEPQLVNPLSVKKRSMHTIEGRAIAIHALAHIEFNAINLALDAVCRFPNMPDQYYLDWIKVSGEEAKHFFMLKNHLKSLGFDYGNFPAHDSLWEMVEKTKGDILARMALVPRTMEAKGLDAVPLIRARFLQAKDLDMVDILDVILKDEIGHVEIGNRWFNFLCKEQEVDPIQIFNLLCRQYKAPHLRGPFNIEARKQAGFTVTEINLLLDNYL